MKYITFCFAAFAALFLRTAYGQVEPNTALQAFPLTAVRLLNGQFKNAQRTDLKYMMALDPDRLLAPYLREAGLTPKAASYGNWENTGLDGHIGGHYLSALSFMYASTGDANVLKRLNYMLSELKRCQDANGDGYVGSIPGGKAMWADIGQGKINANSFGLNGKWVPLYNIHKLYAGLYDAAVVTNSALAKDILIRLTNWFYDLTALVSNQQAQQMLRAEQGGINETFANVYALTGNKKYLELARKFSHRAILDPLLQHKDALTGLHANTQIPKVIGFERIAQLSGDTAWHNAADHFWHTVTDHRSVAFGGNSVREHFNPVDNFSTMLESREGPETCNSYNMLKLAEELFLAKPSAVYMDQYERTLYNHILSTQRPEGGFVYFTPIRPGHYRVYSQPQQGFWCCVGSGMENHGKYGEMIYAHSNRDLYVNLFMASTLNWKEKGLTLEQRTTFPYSERSAITLNLKKPSRFAVNIRYPSWVQQGKMMISVNGKQQPIAGSPGSYAAVDRTWRNGDVITVQLPMHTTAEFLPDDSNWVAFLRGPIVLAASMGTHDQPGVTANDSRMGHIASGKLMPLDDAPLIVSTDRDVAKTITAGSKPMHYNASKLIYQDKYRDLTLVPFNTLHNTRYVMYFPYTSKADLPNVIAAMKLKEAAKQKLDAATVDVVTCGEQQPESDHAFKGEDTSEGSFAEQHYRTGKGWFSYVLNNKQAQATNLRLTYYGGDKGRQFDITVNGELLKAVSLDGTGGKQFVEVNYQLTPAMMKAALLEVKFIAAQGSAIANIYEVRLMTSHL